jgi:hypothetical protein
MRPSFKEKYNEMQAVKRGAEHLERCDLFPKEIWGITYAEKITTGHACFESAFK